MPWSCAACTYLNSEDDGAAKSCCSICFLPRADAVDLAAATTASRKRPAANNTVQATLFGGVVAKALDGNTIAPSKKAKQSAQNQRKCKDSAQPTSSPSKKGPMEPSSDKSHRQGTLAFFGTSTKSTLNNIQPGTDAARECRDLALRECFFYSTTPPPTATTTTGSAVIQGRAQLKQRAATLAQPVKKSELLRAGLKVLAGLSDAALRSALQAVPSIKTGRPKAEVEATNAAPAAKASAKSRK